MNKKASLSTKRKFLLITVCVLLVYSMFFVICKACNILSVLYDKNTASTYYMLTYVLLVACAYGIDTQRRKDPAYLVCFAVPAYTFFYLFLTFMSCNVEFIWISVMSLVVAVAYVGMYFVYKKLLPKIINVKHLYGIVVFLYVIIVMTFVLYLGLSYVVI